MEKCNCYHEYHGKPECWGTKERDSCSCGGDGSKCDFYPEKRLLGARLKLLPEQNMEEAIIRASTNAGLTHRQLIDTNTMSGLMGVYNLGMEHMYKYLNNIQEDKPMNNETIKRFDITIKLRGDNVYDLYLDGEWISSRGSCENILDEARNAIKKSLMAEV